MLGLFVRGVVCGKSKELENVRRVNILTQLLDQTLLRGVHFENLTEKDLIELVNVRVGLLLPSLLLRHTFSFGAKTVC